VSRRDVRGETNGRRDLHEFQGSGIMLYSLFVLFKSECAFCLFERGLDGVGWLSFWGLCLAFSWLIASEYLVDIVNGIGFLQYVRCHGVNGVEGMGTNERDVCGSGTT